MKYVIRLWGMEISNIKNVIHGEIEMPQNKKGSILGIYGANGSGKTVVVDCMVLLKYLLSGRQIPSNFYYYINEASNTSSVKYRFELKIEEKCYLVEYEIELLKTVRRASASVKKNSAREKCPKENGSHLFLITTKAGKSFFVR